MTTITVLRHNVRINFSEYTRVSVLKLKYSVNVGLLKAVHVHRTTYEDVPSICRYYFFYFHYYLLSVVGVIFRTANQISAIFCRVVGRGVGLITQSSFGGYNTHMGQEIPKCAQNLPKFATSSNVLRWQIKTEKSFQNRRVSRIGRINKGFNGVIRVEFC